ncbi:MAG: methyltransferase domain-containing protein [Methylococcales bacterium]|nr:methyltransferase domain-containing protein [Methylococcales bacterium]
MDKKTITAYDQQAKSIAKLHANLIPQRLYQLIEQFFVRGASTLDMGCGIGRDSFYLQQQGFQVLSVDASKNMLEQMKQLYPSVTFVHDALPDLTSLENASFQNIFCSAVLMHLPLSTMESTCKRFAQLLKPHGCLIISFRDTQEKNKREQGKLYETINALQLCHLFSLFNCSLLFSEIKVEKNRNLYWQNMVFSKR